MSFKTEDILNIIGTLEKTAQQKIWEKISSDEEATSISSFMIEFPQFNDVPYQTLVNFINKMRKNPPPEVALIIQSYKSPLETLGKVLNELDVINEFEDLDWVVQVQKDRLKMGIEVEKKVKMPVKTNDKIVSTLTDVLTKKLDLKMRLMGINPNVLQVLNVVQNNPTAIANIQNTINDEKVVAVLGDDFKRQQIISLLEEIEKNPELIKELEDEPEQ